MKRVALAVLKCLAAWLVYIGITILLVGLCEQLSWPYDSSAFKHIDTYPSDIQLKLEASYLLGLAALGWIVFGTWGLLAFHLHELNKVFPPKTN
jgi:hypothetical protein